MDVLLDDVDVGDSPDCFADDNDADIVVMNLLDAVVNDVVNDNVDDDSAIVVVDELCKGDVEDDNYEDGNDAS